MHVLDRHYAYLLTNWEFYFFEEMATMTCTINVHSGTLFPGLGMLGILRAMLNRWS